MNLDLFAKLDERLEKAVRLGHGGWIHAWDPRDGVQRTLCGEPFNWSPTDSERLARAFDLELWRAVHLGGPAREVPRLFVTCRACLRERTRRELEAKTQAHRAPKELPHAA